VRLAGHVAAVTGAASGIGQAAAEGLAREGASVMCLDINVEGADATARRIASANGQAAYASCDITEYESVQEALSATVSTFGKVDVLFANAGGMPSHDPVRSTFVPFLDLTPESWNHMITLNLTGAFYSGLVFARHMVAGKGGSIIFTASQLAEVARIGRSHYATAKAGVRHLVKSMALELATRGVRVNAIAPGVTITGLTRDRMLLAPFREETERSTPMGRPATPSEMVGAVIYLASDEASFTTGQTIFIDGGWTIV
jgi:NAD(P)-dependent dehydrogenase (short-subunit alcohol dehydrogenase family)